MFTQQTHLENFLKSAKYSDSELKLLDEMIERNSNFMNDNAITRNPRQWFDNFLNAEKLLSERFSRENPKPLAGDAVRIVCKNGNVYENALIAYSPNTLNHKFVVVPQGGGHIYDVNQSPTECLAMSICGGPFIGVHPDEFSDITDSVDRSFWFWADRPKAHGGLYITRPVLRWHLKEINPDFY